jgi:hypothetical protein
MRLIRRVRVGRGECVDGRRCRPWRSKDADLGILAAARCVRVDDVVKDDATVAPWPPAVSNRNARTLTSRPWRSGEPCWGYRAETRWLRDADKHLGHLFRLSQARAGDNTCLRRSPLVSRFWRTGNSAHLPSSSAAPTVRRRAGRRVRLAQGPITGVWLDAVMGSVKAIPCAL